MTLLDRLAETHRPVKRRDVHAFVEQYAVQCPACDGNSWQLWQPGDPPYACDLWREYQATI
jgi:hypothetical protein